MNDLVEEFESPNPEKEMTIGNNLRATRLEKGWSLRQLATEADVSPSLISQIENGRTMPSVRTLYSLAEALSLPITHLVPIKELPAEEQGRPADFTSLTPSELRAINDGILSSTDSSPKHLDQPVLRRGERPKIPLQGGIIWERLTHSAEQAIEFLQTEYPPGASSGKRMSQHAGREFGLILEGELTLEFGFETYTLQPGDSIAFDSTRPHRLVNHGEGTMRAIWVIWEK